MTTRPAKADGPDLDADLAALRDSAVAAETRDYVDGLAARREHRRQRAKSMVRPLQAGVAALLALCGAAGIHHWSAREAPSTPAVYASAVGQIRSLRLIDGSQVTLDTDSRIAVRMSDDARTLTLISGRAAFDVAHDPARPFSVAAGGMTVTALGTRFAVTALPREQGVALLHGRVRVDAPGSASVSLTPGQGTELRPGHGLAPAYPIASDTALGWQKGEMEFRNATVAEVIEQANRYLRVKIVLADPAVRDRGIDGLFRAGDTRALVASLCSYFDLQIVERGADRIVLGRT